MILRSFFFFLLVDSLQPSFFPLSSQGVFAAFASAGPLAGFVASPVFGAFAELAAAGAG
jgi:hypothetical protein